VDGRARGAREPTLARLLAKLGGAALALTSLVALAMSNTAPVPAMANTAPVPDLPAAQAPRVTLTTVNWGSPVSLLDPTHPGWAHVAPLAGATAVTATIALNGLPVHSWVAHLDAPLAYGGQQPEDCRGAEVVAPAELSCVFEVLVGSGLIPLAVNFTVDGRVAGVAQGAISGGELEWDADFEVLDAASRWTVIARDRPVVLAATAPTALRLVVTNRGTIPMRLEASQRAAAGATCGSRILAPHEQLRCQFRGVRPAQSLSGDRRQQMRVVDAVGGIGEYEARGGLATFSGTFSLSEPSAIVGKSIVVRARGLPDDQALAVLFQIDDRAVLGTNVTRGGSREFGFKVPALPPGTFHLNVVYDGVTVASLPFDVTRVPRAPDAIPPPWGLLAVPLVGLAVLLLVRRRRPLKLASRESHPTDPYPGATPATLEPEDGHPR
jgi:hypothetical protein